MPEEGSEGASSRRDAIMDAALLLFATNGLDGASVEDIARSAGIGKGTIYLYFRSKDEIFDAILAERWPGPYLQGRLPDVLNGPEAQQLPVEVVLERLATGFLDALERNMLVLRLAVAEAYRFPDTAEHLFETTFLKANRLLAAFLERRAQAGEIRLLESPLIAARCLQGMLMTYVLSQEMLGGKKFTPMSRGEWIKGALNIFMHGVAAAGREPQSADNGRRPRA